MSRLRDIPPRERMLRALFAAATLYLAYLSLAGIYHSLGYGPGRDAQLFHYIAHRLLAGDVPYRDLFDYNMPGTYWVHMGIISLFGHGDLAFRLTDLAWLSLSAWIVGWMIWPYSRWLALWGATLWFAHHGTTGEGFIFQRDFMIACLMLASSAVIIHAQESSRYDRLNQLALYAIAGLLAGFAGGIKPTALGICAAHGLWLLATTRGAVKAKILAASSYSFGVILILASFALWIVAKGGWPYFVDIVLNFIPVFRTTFLPFIAGGVLANPTSWSTLFAPMAVIIWLALVLLIFFRAHTHSRLWFAFLCTLPCALHVYIQDKGWHYHYYPLYGFAVVYIALAIQVIVSQLIATSKAAATITNLGAITIMLMASWHLLSSKPRPFDVSNSSDRRERFARELSFQIDKAAEHMPPVIRDSFLSAREKPVLVMIYFCDACNMWSSAYRLNWNSPSPYLFTQPINPRYKPYYKKARQRFIRTIIEQAPPIIIYSGSGGIIPELRKENPTLDHFMRAHYKDLTTKDRYTLFVLVKDPHETL
jgi:hypothetical protein